MAAERSEGARVRLRRPLVRERNSPVGVNDKGRPSSLLLIVCGPASLPNHHQLSHHGGYIRSFSRGPARSWLVSTSIFFPNLKSVAKETSLLPSTFSIATHTDTIHSPPRRCASETADPTLKRCTILLTRLSVLMEVFGEIGCGLVS